MLLEEYTKAVITRIRINEQFTFIGDDAKRVVAEYPKRLEGHYILEHTPDEAARDLAKLWANLWR